MARSILAGAEAVRSQSNCLLQRVAFEAIILVKAGICSLHNCVLCIEMRFYDTIHSTTIPSTQLEAHSSSTNTVAYSLTSMQQQHNHTFGGSVCCANATNEVLREVSGLC